MTGEGGKMMRQFYKCAFVAACAWATFGMASGAIAQQNTAASSGGSDTIQEIVVTANKREENLNKVGSTVTAISGDMLAERKVTSLEDLASAIPGLTYTASSSNTPIFTLRGVGFNDNSLGIYPAVTVYVDQAPLPFPVLAMHSSYDLERVEVLKGPQGTLFGTNSTGGAINYVAAKPTSSFEAGGDVTYGRFNETEENVYVSGPINDTLRARVAVSAMNRDGWQYSATRPQDSNGKQSYIAGRLLLDWDAASFAHLHFNLNGWSDTSEPQAGQLIAIRPQTPPALPQEVIYPLSPANNDRVADWSTGDFKPRGDRNLVQVAMRADFDLPHDLTLTSQTSYDYFKQNMTVDSDGSALVINDLEADNGTIKSFNQEVRLANSVMSPYRWVVGGNFEHSSVDEYQDLRYFDDSVNNAALAFIDNSGVIVTQRFTNYAGFGNVEYDLVPQLTLKGGVRYTHTKDDGTICGNSPGDAHVADLYNVLGKLLGKVPFAPIGPNDCYSLNENLVPGEKFVSTLAQSNVSWRGGLDYRLDANTLLYFNVSRGFKSGSYPSLAASRFSALQPVTQESLTAYEAGSKAGFWDKKVEFNAALFYYDYVNKQVRGKKGDLIFGILDLEVNIPKSQVYGAEAELTIKPSRGLTVNPNITYLDSKIKEYSGFTVLGQTEDFAGTRLPFTPKWNYGVNIDQRFQFSEGVIPFVGVSVAGHSSSDAALGGSNITIPFSAQNRLDPITHPFVLNSVTTVDARVGFEARDARWKVMLWGKNILDKYYWNNAVIANDSIFRLTGMPATYGVTLSGKF
jgi:iron complex outermembrane receptor protein